jgi:SPP1 family predicted phage head-tail adaptor
MASIRAGALRHQIALQAKTRTSDGQGGHTFAWATIATVWARVVPSQLSGDSAEADQTVSRRAYEITIRRRAGVTSALRVLRGSQVLEITAVLPSDDTPDALTLECREVPA